MVNFPSKLPAPVAWVWGGLQPVTHWVQCSYSVCDQLSVSGWNEPICKKDSRDAHKIMRQITSGDTCISLHSASKKFLDILLVMILKITDRPLKKTLFFLVSYRGYAAWVRGDEEEKTASTWKQRILSKVQRSICFWSLSWLSECSGGFVSLRKPVATPDLYFPNVEDGLVAVLYTSDKVGVRSCERAESVYFD